MCGWRDSKLQRATTATVAKFIDPVVFTCMPGASKSQVNQTSISVSLVARVLISCVLISADPFCRLNFLIG